MGASGSASNPSFDPELRDVTAEVLELLEDHLHVRHFRKGNLLWREGDTSGMLVSLRSGRVKVYRLLPTGQEVTLYLFGPGDLFGFLPFLDGQPYPAYARAVEDAEADVMVRASLHRALEAEPELAIRLITLLGARLRTQFDLVRTLSIPSARMRVAHALLAAHSPEAAGRPTIDLPVSNRDFARTLGLAPETLSRVLTLLVDEGILERAGSGRYRVLDPEGLARAAQPDPD